MAKKRSLPFNLDAEKAVLGAMLVSENAIFDCMPVLSEESFYDEDPKNRLVFRAISKLYKEQSPVDIQTVTNELIVMNAQDIVGAPEYLLNLTEETFSLSNLSTYLRMVKDNALLRKYLITLESIQNNYNSNKISDISTFIQDADKMLRDVAENRSIGEFKTSKEVVMSVNEAIQNQKKNDSSLLGVTTGYPKLDEYTLGLQKKDMVVVAARPSVGKTQFAINLLYNVARNASVPVAMFSLEMPAEMLVKRLLAVRSEINLKKIQLGHLEQHELNTIKTAVSDLANVKMYIDDSPNCTLMNIITKARQLKAKEDNLGLIVIDYIGLITLGAGHKSESRQQDVSYISASLKQLAREIDCPIIVISQLSREVEKRESNRPTLADLRESGAIEQDADVVMLLYNETQSKLGAKLLKTKGGQMADSDKTKMAKKQAMDQLMAGLGENVQNLTIVVAKNRNGQIGDVNLHFFKNYGAFVPPSEKFLQELERIKSMSDDD